MKNQFGTRNPYTWTSLAYLPRIKHQNQMVTQSTFLHILQNTTEGSFHHVFQYYSHKDNKLLSEFSFEIKFLLPRVYFNIRDNIIMSKTHPLSLKFHYQL